MKCDLFCLGEYSGCEFKLLQVFDKKFVCDIEKIYSGYMGLNVDRLKMVSIVIESKRKGLEVFSVPVKYRDEKNINFEAAEIIASVYAKSKGFDIEYSVFFAEKASPVYWLFRIVNHPDSMLAA